jgi:hypothetical protein
MQNSFVDADILARFEPEIKPERQFQHSESDRSQDSGSPEISQKERSPVTMRSPRSGKPIPCDSCGEIWISDDRCVRCGVGRAGIRTGKPGLEAIGSIIHRMYGGES